MGRKRVDLIRVKKPKIKRKITESASGKKKKRKRHCAADFSKPKGEKE